MTNETSVSSTSPSTVILYSGSSCLFHPSFQTEDDDLATFSLRRGFKKHRKIELNEDDYLSAFSVKCRAILINLHGFTAFF